MIQMRSIVIHLSIWILLVAVIFESVTFCCWLERAVLGENESCSLILNYESHLFNSLSAIVPILALLLMFSWIIWPLRAFLHTRKINISYKKAFLEKIMKIIHSATDEVFGQAKSIRYLDSRILASASLVLTILVTVYPFMPRLNPHGKIVGVDIPSYEMWLLESNLMNDFRGVLQKAFFQYPDRPLALILLFSLWKTTWLSARQIAEYSYVLLGLLLLLVTYLFTRLSGFNRSYASLTMLFTVFSYHITTGMYAGFLANWIGLIFLYLFEGAVLAGLKRNSWRYCIAALTFQSLLLFSHANSWDMTMGILGVFFLFLSLEWLRKKENLSRPLMLLVIMTVGVSLKILRNLSLGVEPGTFEAANVAESCVSLVNIQYLWGTLIYSLGSYKGISLMNPILYFLAGLGGLAVALDNRLASRYFTICLLTSSIPFIFGNHIVQSRIIYDLPLHIFSIFGLCVLLSFTDQLLKGEKNGEKIGLLLVLLVFFVNLNYALRCSFYLTQITFFPVR